MDVQFLTTRSSVQCLLTKSDLLQLFAGLCNSEWPTAAPVSLLGEFAVSAMLVVLVVIAVCRCGCSDLCVFCACVVLELVVLVLCLICLLCWLLSLCLLAAY